MEQKRNRNDKGIEGKGVLQKWNKNGTEMVKELRKQEFHRYGPEIEQKW